jgi:CRP-like cAMP-binding protein
MDLFADTSRSQLVQIAQQLTRVSVKAGRVLVHEGARGDEFMIVLDGQAEVSQHGRRIATIGRGDLIGEMALVQQNGRGTRNATVTAATDMVLYVGSPAEFRQIIHVAPSVAAKVHQTVASRTLAAA